MTGGEDVHGPSLLIKISITAFFPQECSGGAETEQEAHKVKAAHSLACPPGFYCSEDHDIVSRPQ